MFPTRSCCGRALAIRNTSAVFTTAPRRRTESISFARSSSWGYGVAYLTARRNFGFSQKHLSSAAQTGSDTLAISPSAVEAESNQILNSHKSQLNPVDSIILEFNTLRRIHMAETRADQRKQIEAQAWRKIQNVSEAQIDLASDYGVTLVVSSWAYFSRHWENGQRGPVPPSLANEANTTSTGTSFAVSKAERYKIDPVTLSRALDDAYPTSNDVKVEIDHMSALIHELDIHGGNNETIDNDDVDGSLTSDEDLADESLIKEDDLTQQSDISLERGSEEKDTSANNTNAKPVGTTPQTREPSPRKMLNRKKTTNEAVETPRAEVLDEVFE